MRIFLDANVLFSAAKSDGAVAELVKRLLQAGHECCADSYVIEEARRTLAAKAPSGVAALDALLERLRIASAVTAQVDTDVIDWLPEKDRPVLGSAIRMRCAALVSGDRTHFGAGYGKSFGGVTIYSPRSLAEKLLK